MKNMKKTAAFGAAFALAGLGFVTPAFADVHSAEIDVDYFCTPGAETYDMAKCAQAEDTLKAEKAKAEEANKQDEQAEPAGDTVKKELKDKDLDATWKCAEGSEYYDFNECMNLKADIKDLTVKDAELDVTWYCAEGTEYYDMVKCADAQDKLGKLTKVTKVPETAPTVADKPEGYPLTKLTPAKETPATKDMKLTPAKKANEAKKGELAKTGVAVGALAGIAALSTLGGAATLRRRNH
ncbi:hypothetical protein [Arcanobacterium phocae]|uniref:hypothetical protein n=1 Tax=Arcanobacterium phocae TaxID=131112 RepID=UPI001C0EC087|nr:hypothetical protein [Arcanobacterium phocae]